MSRTIDHLVRPNIRSLMPYHSARQDHLRGILLDANENAFGSSAAAGDLPLNRYPDPLQAELRSRLAALNGVRSDDVFVGVGSDEAIDLAVRIFCEPAADNVVIPQPTYGMYAVAAAIQNVEVRSCPLTADFQIDRNAVAALADGRTKLIFCCSPNNPTGNLLRREDLLALCDRDVVVVVDEAYGEFAGTPSLAAEAAVRPNLIVLRTLSKAWGLAGIRCGYAVAHPSVIGLFLRVKSPYNVNALTSRVALEALADAGRMHEVVARIREERTWLAAGLASLPCITEVFPSDANFLLVRTTGADRLYDHLAANGIIVRNRTRDLRLEECLRITVGTRPQNELLLATLRGAA